MKEINIGRILIKKRREKAITQDELASYIGVSKASVSKWETGQSYPDITFLPQLAAYFNISIDDLMDYEPQMTKEDIKKLYHRISKDFAEKNFNEVIGECQNIIKKYYSCFPLLLQMAVLLINHHMLDENPEKRRELLNEALDLCIRVKEESNDVWILKEEAMIEGTCYLILNEPQNVLELFGETIRPIETNIEMIAQAFQLMGNNEKAKEALQISSYQHLLLLISDATQLMFLNSDNPQRVNQILNRTLSVAETFEVDKLHPNTALQVYLSAAQIFCALGDKEKALEMFAKLSEICINGLFPYSLHGDEYFDKLSDWFETFDLGKAAPRDENIIKESIMSVIQNPAFEILNDSPKYKNIAERIKSALGCK